MQSYCLAAAGQMNTSRLVVRFRHGIYGAGAGLDETFGRIEAAETYKKITRLPLKITISDSRMRQLARHFKVTPREGILSDVVKQGRGE